MNSLDGNDDFQLLQELIAEWESETVEFKQAGEDFSTDRIGQYFSALSNEAELHNTSSAWLVFGVNDKTRKIAGTSYRNDPNHLNQLKN